MPFPEVVFWQEPPHLCCQGPWETWMLIYGRLCEGSGVDAVEKHNSLFVVVSLELFAVLSLQWIT